MRNAYDEIHNEYHPAPPPSPNFGSTGSMNLLKRRIRTKEMERKYLERRKFLVKINDYDHIYILINFNFL